MKGSGPALGPSRKCLGDNEELRRLELLQQLRYFGPQGFKVPRYGVHVGFTELPKGLK